MKKNKKIFFCSDYPNVRVCQPDQRKDTKIETLHRKKKLINKKSQLFLLNLNLAGFIYLITNLINNKVYVGKAEESIRKRWREHKWRANNLNRVKFPLAIDLAINKYGIKNFKIAEIERVYGTRLDLLNTEKYYIDEYDSANPEKGYNIDPMDWIDDIRQYEEDYESIWRVPSKSKAKKEEFEKWKESLVKLRIPTEMEEQFIEDLRNLSGLKLEEKYGFHNARRSLLREIRRILKDDKIKTIEQAKKKIGGIITTRKDIPKELENQFIRDLRLLSGVDLEKKYKSDRKSLVRNIKKIFKQRGSTLLERATTLTEIKEILGGKIYDPKKKKKFIPSERVEEFKNDVKGGLKLRDLCKKYNIGRGVFYRELNRLLGAKRLEDIRETTWIFPPRKKIYIFPEKKKQFISDLRGLSGAELENKYDISDRRILLREIRRILHNDDLNNMEDVKKFVGGRPYNIEDIKKSIPPEREEEFKIDVRIGLSKRDLFEKYDLSTKPFYRELERLFGTRSLKEARRKIR
ncbi:MAG: GIY-YIG nuclease family protein [Promethearchaeota archaeon]|nr:MAG: GIY-YIG nuclease family protein [Candidatus Lokiarchaeota archaeon]